ncbi:hypothetical protein BOW53_15160 [Solemya pervernicosa gill symbiont]|uniref:Lcl C-terminal domain-containing protein n=1 Tax=Solemya pervernicosa gill symbiont TaxID=642797 RepID=A0A1T2L0B2_9GAMM|nr:DUF1566 domain-containing protein [Solemya pervernicosa gill symbiont]OOZ38543.1 hypothetical protein BOW53_15160 [Solemya pervernicosa gill symbiont]
MKNNHALPLTVLMLSSLTLLTGYSCKNDGSSGGASSAATTQPLNDTGITDCATDRNGNLACNDTFYGTTVFPGQDAEHGRDATLDDDSDGHAGFAFTKLGADGSVLAIQSGAWDDNGSEAAGTKWSCIEDVVTGLVWEVKTNNTVPDLHHGGWTYSWYSSDGATNGGNAGTADGGDNCFDGARCDTEKYVADVNTAALCGYSDWRLPNREVLRSIVDYSIASPGPTIDSGWFPNTVNDWTWASSTHAAAASLAVDVNFYDGSGNRSSKSSNNYVRLMRDAR